MTPGKGTREQRRWGPGPSSPGYPWPGNTLENVIDTVHFKITFPLPLRTYYSVYGLSRPLMVFLFSSTCWLPLQWLEALNPGNDQWMVTDTELSYEHCFFLNTHENVFIECIYWKWIWILVPKWDLRVCRFHSGWHVCWKGCKMYKHTHIGLSHLNFWYVVYIT